MIPEYKNQYHFHSKNNQTDTSITTKFEFIKNEN